MLSHRFVRRPPGIVLDWIGYVCVIAAVDLELNRERFFFSPISLRDDRVRLGCLRMSSVRTV